MSCSLIEGVVEAYVSAFGGLVVSMLASGTQDRGLEPGQSRRIFRAKKSTACLPSEGKWSRLSHIADPCNLRGQIDRSFLAHVRPPRTEVCHVAWRGAPLEMTRGTKGGA
jgi:hypothetical protein